MDKIFIKEEVEEDSCHSGGVSSASYSLATASISSSSSTNTFPPTQRVLPSTLLPRRPVVTHYIPGGASEELSKSIKPPSLKRKCGEIASSTSKHSRSPLSLLSPSLFPLQSPPSKVALVPGYPAQEGGDSPRQEDEWKNIKVVRLTVLELSKSQLNHNLT